MSSFDPGTHQSASNLSTDAPLTCDVLVIGSGAGGAVAAANFAKAGLEVLLIEEGPYRTRKDWIELDESKSYRMLYQERAARATSDMSIAVFQGRAVGGTTVVNWTTCFRTPEWVFDHWKAQSGLTLNASTLAPHWAAVEERLSIQPWPEEMVNANNGVLLRGCRELGWEHEILRRNVKGCANSGYCGLGCPVGGKQAMHLTYIPDALSNGARLVSDLRADRLITSAGQVTEVQCTVMDPASDGTNGPTLSIRPGKVVLAAGAINTPAILLRSGLNDNQLVGRRTFLHPTVGMRGLFDETIAPYYGAPQSVASHQFLHRGEDKVGYFFEVAPMQPMLASLTTVSGGQEKIDMMRTLPHNCALISLAADGFAAGDEGGVVSLKSDGRVQLDYPISDPLREMFQDSHKTMAQLLFAAGAKEVHSGHIAPVVLTAPSQVDQLDLAPYGAHEHAIFSAHCMGGCPMGTDRQTSVVGPDLRHHGISNLLVMDGSVLPTSLGVNPSLSIYGLSHWSSSEHARLWTA